MEIQGLTKSNATNPIAAAAAAAAGEGVAPENAFSAVLELIGSNFNGGMSTNAMDTKLMRAADEAAAAKRGEESGEVGKLREKGDDDRTPKAKETKNRDDEDESDADETDAAAADTKGEDDTAATAQNAGDQAAAQVVDTIAIETLVATAEVVAPIVIAQQVVAQTDAAVTQQASGEVVQAVAAADVVATDTGAKLTDAPKAAIVEAPAAMDTNADANQPKFQQVLKAAAGTQETAATETTTVEVAQEGEQTVAKTSDNSKNAQVTQKSASAQEQSQALSQQLGEDVKAKVQVTVRGPAVANQTVPEASAYNIYGGYNAGQGSNANGQVGVADASNALVQGAKSPAEQGQAQPSPASPPVAPPQTQTQPAQQGASSSAVRADVAAPAPTQAGNTGSQPNAGFSQGFSNTQANSETTEAQQANNPQKPSATAQQVIDQIKVNITRAAKAGLDRVTIQLKPQELGRIEVQLEMSEDHQVRVTVTADNKDTLALLQNDSRTLERALNDAGLRTDTANLHFNLRSESDPRTADGSNQNGNGSGGANDNDAGMDETDEAGFIYDYAAAARARGGVDTFA